VCLQCVKCLIRIWQDDNEELHSAADRCLELLTNSPDGARWKEIVQERLFEAYNEEWLERIQDAFGPEHPFQNCLRRSRSGLKQALMSELSDKEPDF